jgi:arginine utilization protein RocB
MDSKGKFVDTSKNTMVLPPIDLDHIPLKDRDYKVAEPNCDFNLFNYIVG